MSKKYRYLIGSVALAIAVSGVGETSSAYAEKGNTQKVTVSDTNKMKTKQTVTEEKTEQVFIPANSLWSYNDLGRDLGTAWIQSNYDISSWKSDNAPLGFTATEKGAFGTIGTVISYGDDSSIKYPTTYFAKSFTIDKLQSLRNTTEIKIAVDDSAIIYLNGTEIERVNLNEGGNSYNKYAQDFGNSESPEGTTTIITLSEEEIALLKEGTNTLAVEVKNHRPSSSDLYFDLTFKSYDKSFASNIAFAPGSDETQRTLNWYTGKTEHSGVVELTKQNAKGKVVSKTTFEATVADTSSGESSHKATITGLTEDSNYSYRIGDGNGNWTKSYEFETQDTEEFNFLFFGDVQIGASGNAKTDGDSWESTLSTTMERYPDTAFLVSAGDQVNTATNESQYDEWFAPEELTKYPISTTIGNHDNSAVFSEHFNVPNATGLGDSVAGSDYYYVYGDTLFMVLNTQSSDNAEHKLAMEQAIADNPNVKNKIVVLHKSIYSTASHATDSDILNFRANLVPIFDELDIDVALMGHDHVYVRTFQMLGDAPVEKVTYDDKGAAVNPEGTLYLTGNSSTGSKFYNLKSESIYANYANVTSQLKEPTYMNTEVDGDSMTFTTYNVSDNSVVDTYTIVKEPTVIERIEAETAEVKEKNNLKSITSYRKSIKVKHLISRMNLQNFTHSQQH
ncbi:purple acid phosphatase family protein [Paenisporosarcina indica]|uniref:purple acid phosphatase family protein n=1 Tax=Paenisporosarcina indica TaxID=650093 RepID=UPI0009502112|nr:metallophosphoesterase family protein [Paenisporosarcina indica]